MIFRGKAKEEEEDSGPVLTEKEQQEEINRIRTENEQWNFGFYFIFGMGATLLASTFFYLSYMQYVRPYTTNVHVDFFRDARPIPSSIADLFSSLSFLACALAMLTRVDRFLHVALALSVVPLLYWGTVFATMKDPPYETLWLPLAAGAYALTCVYCRREMESTREKLRQLKESVYRATAGNRQEL